MKFHCALVVLALTGCASTPVDLSTVDAGPPPTTHEQDVQTYLKGALLDPDSIKDLRITPPVKCAWRLEAFAKPTGGWCSQVSYNAKNVYGGYVGLKIYNTFTRDNQLMRMSEHWEPPRSGFSLF